MDTYPRVVGPIQADDVVIMAGVLAVQRKRCKLGVLAGCSPHLHVLAISDGEKLAVGAELDVVDGLFEVEVV